MDDLLSLVQDALDLSETAIAYDLDGNYVLACDFYDKAILHLDESLNNLAFESSEYNVLILIRSKYETRMELLRAHEAAGHDLGVVLPPEHTMHDPQTKTRRMSHMRFDAEMDPVDVSFESPPPSVTRHPYWQLRVLQKVITVGGCLSPTIFVPAAVWNQYGIKFSGLTMKTNAFQQLISSMEEHIEPLCFPEDIASLRGVTEAFHNFIDDAYVIQNALAKPFPFIREISESATSSQSQAGVARLTNIMAGFGKSAVKHAEIAYQRIGAMTTRISDEEFSDYVSLITVMCGKCQILDRWHEYLDSQRGAALNETFLARQRASSSAGNDVAPEDLPPSEDGAMGEASPPDGVSAPDGGDNILVPPLMNPSTPSNPKEKIRRSQYDDGHISPDRAWWIHCIEGLLANLLTISVFIRETICEILLRDTEMLLLRYLRKSRKGFCRMHWDVDEGDSSLGSGTGGTGNEAFDAMNASRIAAFE